MKPFFRPLPLVLALAVAIGGCEKTVPPPEDKVLFQAIEDNARAFNQKDVDGVMATVHPNMPTFGQLREFITQIFREVQLKVTISDLKVMSASPDQARVSFKQKTDQMTDGHLVPLNIVEGVHTLRPDHGTWKIFETDNTKVTRFNETAPGATENKPPAAGIAPTPTAPAPEPAKDPIGATPTGRRRGAAPWVLLAFAVAFACIAVVMVTSPSGEATAVAPPWMDA